MLDGKKSVSEKIVYGAFSIVLDKTREEPLKVFERALQNCKPDMEVKSRRVGGANYQVPVQVREDRRVALSMRWLIQFARKRSGRTMREKLAAELIEAANERGNAFKKREDTHRMAEANKAFSHYRW
jgi:small subunit ribosomal protein S7